MLSSQGNQCDYRQNNLRYYLRQHNQAFTLAGANNKKTSISILNKLTILSLEPYNRKNKI